MRPALDFVSPFTGQDMAQLLAARAQSRGAHPFLVWAPFEGEARTWSYAQFATQVARLAGGLAARGIRPGDRVIVHMDNCPEFLLAWFACAHLGAVCVPTNAMAVGPEFAWFAELSGARAAITQPSFAAMVMAHGRALEWTAVTGRDNDAAPGAQAAVPPAGALPFAALEGDPLASRAPDPAAHASIMFTSGTTSRSKGVLWTHANALWGARLGAQQQGLRADDVYQVCLPLFHVVALSWSVFPALWAGATVLLQPRFSASRYWPAALAHGATVASHVHFTAGVLARQPVPAGHRFRQWGNSIWLTEQARHFGIPIVGWWGMTEVVSQGIVGDPHAPQGPGTIGWPSPAYRIKVVDETGAPVAPGDTGHLLLGGVPGLSLFAGYWNDPQATEAAFDAGGWFITGDRVSVQPDGAIRFAERAKDVLKVGGEGVSAAEIERVVLEVEGVHECAVVGRPDPAYGEVAVAFVTLKPGAPADIATRVIQHSSQALARFKVPREVIVIDAMPRVTIGKIGKGELRRQLASRTPTTPN
jgi:crotonobetaine/carnitine-CoA ligase